MRVHCKKAAYDVYIGRPGPYGNPFVIGRDGTREQVIAKFKKYLDSRPDLIERVRRELKDKILGCWCDKNQACHGDVLIEIANDTRRTGSSGDERIN